MIVFFMIIKLFRWDFISFFNSYFIYLRFMGFFLVIILDKMINFLMFVLVEVKKIVIYVFNNC